MRDLDTGRTARARWANPRFVLTGGPGAGKTTLLEALAGRGYRHVPESARALIRRRKAAGLPARPAPDEFARELLRLDIEAYRATPCTSPVFFDRGVVDTLALLDQHSELPGDVIRAHVEAFPYHEPVFVLPPWREIYAKDSERDQDFADSLRVHERLCRWYDRLGYRTVEVPRARVEERADFVLGCVEGASSR